MTDTTVSSAHLSPINLLGERVDGTFTAEEAMQKGHLGGWNVRKVPAVAYDPESGTRLLKDGMSDVIRNNPDTGAVEVLSRYSVSNGFTIVQNEAHAEFLNTLVDESGANFEMAGSQDDGRKVFISMRLPGHILIGGLDQVDVSLCAINSHDGQSSLTLAALPVRYACSNVLNAVYGMRKSVIRLRHTSGMAKSLVSRAREALEISFNYLDEFQETAEQMINTDLTQSRFEEIITKEFGVDEDASASAITRADKKIEEITGLFADAQTQDGIRGTAWAGFNALTEWADHFSPTRGDDRETARALKAVTDPYIKQRALELMLQA